MKLNKLYIVEWLDSVQPVASWYAFKESYGDSREERLLSTLIKVGMSAFSSFSLIDLRRSASLYSTYIAPTPAISHVGDTPQTLASFSSLLILGAVFPVVLQKQYLLVFNSQKL